MPYSSVCSRCLQWPCRWSSSDPVPQPASSCGRGEGGEKEMAREQSDTKNREEIGSCCAHIWSGGLQPLHTNVLVDPRDFFAHSTRIGRQLSAMAIHGSRWRSTPSAPPTRVTPDGAVERSPRWEIITRKTGRLMPYEDEEYRERRCPESSKRLERDLLPRCFVRLAFELRLACLDFLPTAQAGGP